MIVPAGSAVYSVVEAMAPLYAAAVLGYASVRWLKAFTEEQCAGINHFVAIYAVPVLIFHMVYSNDPYHMNARLIAADTLQKVAILLALFAWAWWSRGCRGGGDYKPAASLKWVVTNFSVATMSNTIIIGVPLLDGMYGAGSGRLVSQIVVVQLCFWFNVVIFMYQYMAAQQDGGGDKVCPEPSLVESSGSAGQSRRHDDPGALNIEIADDEVTTRNRITGAAPTTTTMGTEVTRPTPSHAAPPLMHIIWVVGKKLAKIPNTYASFLGLVWSLIAFKFGIKMPKIVDDSLFIIYTTATGLSMFASGTFIARQPRLVPCGYAMASLSMVLKFLVGPVVMLLTSLAVGLHGTVLHIAVVQAALPLAVISFVYAEEFKVHADIMSTGVIIGTFICLPVTILYYILLGL